MRYTVQAPDGSLHIIEGPDDVPQAPSTPIRPMEAPGFMDRVVAPMLEKAIGSNPQGSPVGRLIQGAADPALGIMQMGANAMGLGDPVNQKLHDVEGSYQSQRAMAGSTGFDPLRMTGNVATSLMVPGATAAPSAGLMANLLRAGGMGAAYNLAQPVTNAQPGGDENYATEKAKQGIAGAVVGGVAAPVVAGAARVVSPMVGAAQKTLMDSGVTLTPGDIMGGGLKRLEDAATSWPFVGDLIRNAKNRTLTDLQRATYARALDPIGVDASKLPTGPEGILAVKSALGDAYDKLLPKLSFDVQTIQPKLDQLRQMANAPGGLPAQEAAQFNAILDRNLGQLSSGKADGQTFQAITSDLGKEAKAFGGATDTYQQKLGTALQQAQAVFREGLTASNPEYAAQLGAINKGYANYATIRRAGQMAGADSPKGFSPAQLAAAVRGQDQSVGNGATATGQALMQDLSSAAREVLPSSVADSGTPFRHAVGALAGGAVGHSYLPESVAHLMIPAAAGVGLASLPYTKLGQAAMQKILAERPESAQMIAQLLRRGGPLAGAALAPAITNGQ